MICKHCGSEISDDAKFCPYCGRTIEAAQEPDADGMKEAYSSGSEAEEPKVVFTSVSPRHSYPETEPAQEVFTSESSGNTSGKGFGIAGLVLGICSIVFLLFIIGVLFGIVGIVLSALSLKKEKNGIARAGLVTSIIGVALFVGFLILGVIVAGIGVGIGMYGFLL